MSKIPSIRKAPAKGLKGEVLLLEKVPTRITTVEGLVLALQDLQELCPQQQQLISEIYGCVVNLNEQLQGAAAIIGGALERHRERQTPDAES